MYGPVRTVLWADGSRWTPSDPMNDRRRDRMVARAAVITFVKIITFVIIPAGPSLSGVYDPVVSGLKEQV